MQDFYAALYASALLQTASWQNVSTNINYSCHILISACHTEANSALWWSLGM